MAASKPSAPALRACDRAFDRAQQVFHGLCPGLTALFDQRRQCAQMRGIAQGVFTVGLPIGRPGIVHGNAVKLRQQAEGGGGGAPAFGLRGLVRQRRRAGHVQPLPLPGHIQPGLIEVRAVGRLHARFDDRLDLRQSRRTSLLRRAQRARREALPEEIGKQFAGARLRQQLIAAQVDGHGLRARPILHDIRDVGGKRGGLARLAMATSLRRGAMFGDGKTQHR